MSMNFYGSDGAAQGADLASQADPMSPGAGDNVIGAAFGQFEQNAAAAQIGGNPSASVGAGRTVSTKPRLSTGKKVGIAAGVIVAFAAVAVVMTPTAPTTPTVPFGQAQSAAVTPAAPGMLGGAPAPDGATLMGSAPQAAGAAPAPGQAADGSDLIVETPPPAGAEIAAAQSAAPGATAVLLPAPSASTPKPVPSASTPKQVVPPAPLVVDSPATKAAVAAPTVIKPTAVPALVVVPAREVRSADPTDLAARIAVLERRLAKYESRGVAPRRVRETETVVIRELPREDKSATLARAITYVAASNPPVAPMQPTPVRSASSVGGDVRVLGMSTRHGVATALVEFGGSKHRVAVGDRIAGLGPVSSVALDAAGNPVIEINGVRYE